VATSWFLKHHDWRRQLSESARQEADREAEALRLITGQILLAADTPGGFLYLVDAGRLRLSRFDAQGREVVRAILEEGDLLVDETRPDGAEGGGYAEALEDARILRLPLGRLDELAGAASGDFQKALDRARREGEDRYGAV